MSEGWTIDIQKLVGELVFLRRSAPERTKIFRALKHNDDLCPMLQRQLEAMTRGLAKYRPILVYDTQGIRDDGGDIILNCAERDERSGDEHVWLIAFQIKSHADLSDPSCLQKIKAQRDDALRKIVGLKDYYILLCTDEELHKDRIRNISAEFRSADRTLVVEPGFAYQFLHMPELRVNAFLKRMLETGDFVYRLAIDDIERYTPSQAAVASYLIVQTLVEPEMVITDASLHSSGVVQQIYMRIPDVEYDYEDEIWDTLREQDSSEIEITGDGDWDRPMPELMNRTFEERLSADVASLNEGLIDIEKDSGRVLVHPQRAVGLTALIADAMARYGYEPDEIPQYVLEMLGVPTE
jgi:hypothetical protein